MVLLLVMSSLIIMVVGGGRCDSDHNQLPTETAGDGSAVSSHVLISQTSPHQVSLVEPR